MLKIKLFLAVLAITLAHLQPISASAGVIIMNGDCVPTTSGNCGG